MLLSNGISQTLDCLTGGQTQANSVFSVQFSSVLHGLPLCKCIDLHTSKVELSQDVVCSLGIFSVNCG